MTEKNYVVVLQCHIVKERCSGYLCEYAFSKRSGGFTGYPEDGSVRLLTMTCGGCCGRATQRKLANLVKQIKKKEDVEKERIVVHFSSCIAFESYHGPPCPHKDYLTTLVRDTLGLELIEESRINALAEERRQEGKYNS